MENEAPAFAPTAVYQVSRPSAAKKAARLAIQIGTIVGGCYLGAILGMEAERLIKPPSPFDPEEPRRTVGGFVGAVAGVVLLPELGDAILNKLWKDETIRIR